MTNVLRTVVGTTVTYRNAAPYSNCGISIPSNTKNVLFDGCTFSCTADDINGLYGGVVTLGADYMGSTGGIYNITFLNCTFSNNIGAGGGDDFGVNGVKVVTGNNSNNTVNDISFVGCNFGTAVVGGGSSFSRMGYEQVNADNTLACKRVLFRGCIFEPVYGECISDNGGDLYQLIDNCTFKGSSNISGTYASLGWTGELFQGRQLPS